MIILIITHMHTYTLILTHTLKHARLTRVVPTAARSGAPPPAAVHLGEFPLLVGLAGEGIGGEVADLQAGVVPQEVPK